MRRHHCTGCGCPLAQYTLRFCECPNAKCRFYDVTQLARLEPWERLKLNYWLEAKYHNKDEIVWRVYP